LYLVAGIAGNMTSLAWYPFAMSEGASGAIFGLYGALLALFLSRRQTVPAETWARRPKVMAALVGCSLLYGLFGREINVAADTYDDLKEYGKAITAHTEAIRLDPNNPRWYSARSRSYDLLGDRSKAEQDRIKAMAAKDAMPPH
jgi:tetratricopeptide (TPR) repeat protein